MSRDRIGHDVWLVAVVIVLGTIGGLFSVTTVAVGLGRLASDLHSSLDAAQWTITGYILGLAAVVPMTAWMGRRVGARRLYLVTLTLFALTSSLCALAPSMDVLIALRIVQGLAGGSAIPLGQTILATMAGPGRMGRVMSVIGVPMVLAPVTGPILGGVVTQDLGWQWLFLLNVPFALAGLALGARVIPDLDLGAPGRLDVPGLLLLSAGVPLIVFGLANIGIDGGVGHPLAGPPVLAGVALVAGFVVHSKLTDCALMDVGLWRNRGFAACALVTIALAAAQYGVLVLLPLYLQGIHGENILTTGALLAPQGVGAALAMPAAGRLTDAIGGGRVAIAGTLAIMGSTMTLAQLGGGASLVLIELLLLVRGAGQGAAVMPAQAAVFAVLDRADFPEATPQLNLFQRIGGSLGTALLTVVLSSELRAKLPGEANPTAFIMTLHGAPLRAAADAFSIAFWWAAAIAAVTLLPAIVLARIEIVRRRNSAGVAADDEPTMAVQRSC